MNSCLIKRYKFGADHIPPHMDDEPLFDPNCAQSTMSFTDNLVKNSQTLLLGSHSVLVTRAQDCWKHSIEKIYERCEERFSFTCWHIAPHFINLTVIIGDSNTCILHFGEGKGSECQVSVLRPSILIIEDISGPSEIGPYRNVAIIII